MDVAVVIPLFNGADWIRESLDSVRSQTHPPSEIIVVDDGSTDDSPAVVAEDFPEARLITNPGDGPYEARNYGAECASADNVAFIDQDDLWHEDHLKRIRQAFRDFPQSVCAFSKVARFRDSEAPDYSVHGCESHAYNPWDDYPYNGLGETIGAVIRRDAFELVDGGWPEVAGGGVHYLRP
jgi:glycosyltransferase involved in cell wall biosynthesis